MLDIKDRFEYLFGEHTVPSLYVIFCRRKIVQENNAFSMFIGYSMIMFSTHFDEEPKRVNFNLGDNTKGYTSYKEMLAKKPELVAVCTESGEHAEIAFDCIDVGHHVIIEKTITLSLADADEIIARAKTKGVKVCTSHQNRFNKFLPKIREAVDAKRFGKLFYGTAHIPVGVATKTITSRRLDVAPGNIFP